MFDWNSLLDEAALASVLSGNYARFAKPVSEGLIVFLSGLPAAWQEEILAQQAALPLAASISQRLALLARGCPVLHKIGQVLARDQRLAPELREHLRELESMPPTVSESVIRETLTRELGSLERLGIQLAPPALAEASVAVVVPFVSAEGGSGSKQHGGVFKILKPGIEERLGLELELLGRVGVHLDERCAELQLPHLEYEEVFQQIREKLSHEVRLDEEQHHLAQAAACYGDEPEVHIPALREYCTPRVTAMERISGGKITDHRFAPPHERRRLAETVVRALISHPIFSSAPQALFHSDPHAGNLFLTDQNRLAILDWSLVGKLGEEPRAAMVQIMLAAVTLDAPQIVEILEGLSEGGQADTTALTVLVECWLKRIRQGTRPGLIWLTGLLDDAVQTTCLRVAADLMLFRKSLHTLEGVVSAICAEETIVDDVLLAEFVYHFAQEWPLRWLAWPQSRAFATRLSNLDLTRTLLDCPAAVARYWAGQSRDWLDACRTLRKMRA